jgi:hypothetical protein
MPPYREPPAPAHHTHLVRFTSSLESSIPAASVDSPLTPGRWSRPLDLDQCLRQFGRHGPQPSQRKRGTQWGELLGDFRREPPKATQAQAVIRALRVEARQSLGHLRRQFPQAVQPQGPLVAGKLPRHLS